MQYISPLHFIELSSTDTIDRKDLLLARKKMLAELELNEGSGLEINGKEVSRNDIVRFFDDLQQSADLSYHLAIYKDPVLLKFLEYNTLEKNDRIAKNPLYADDAFINWLSPYYAASFVVFAAACFENLADDEWATLLRNPQLMNSYNQETAWEGLEKSMQGDISRLKFYADKKIMTQGELDGISPVCDFRHVMMLERLPEERFRQLRDEMAFSMMQVCINAFNHTNRGWARNTIDNAHILAVSEELKKQVYNKKYEMDSLEGGSSKGGSSNKVQAWTIVRIVLFVLFVGSRLFNNCNRSHDYNYSNPQPIYFQPRPGDTTLERLQEEFRKMNNSNRKEPLSDSTVAMPVEEAPVKRRP